MTPLDEAVSFILGHMFSNFDEIFQLALPDPDKSNPFVKIAGPLLADVFEN